MSLLRRERDPERRSPGEYTVWEHVKSEEEIGYSNTVSQGMNVKDKKGEVVYNCLQLFFRTISLGASNKGTNLANTLFLNF